MLITVVKRDSDGDGWLSSRDLKSVAVAGPSGLGQTKIARDGKALICQSIGADGSVQHDDQAKDGVTRGLKVSLPDFAVVLDDAFGLAASAPG